MIFCSTARERTWSRWASISLGAPTRAMCSIDALGELDRGRSAAVALVGEPGIGKTRLLGELVGHGRTRVGTSCSTDRRRSSSGICPSGCSSTRSTSTFKAFGRVASRHSTRTFAPSSPVSFPRSLGSRRVKPRSSTSATAATAPCASCSSGSPAPGRSCSRSTISTGLTRDPWSCSARCCAARRTPLCSWRWLSDRVKLRSAWPRRWNAAGTQGRCSASMWTL